MEIFEKLFQKSEERAKDDSRKTKIYSVGWKGLEGRKNRQKRIIMRERWKRQIMGNHL